jgi:hypothetical protein
MLQCQPETSTRIGRRRSRISSFSRTRCEKKVRGSEHHVTVIDVIMQKLPKLSDDDTTASLSTVWMMHEMHKSLIGLVVSRQAFIQDASVIGDSAGDANFVSHHAYIVVNKARANEKRTRPEVIRVENAILSSLLRWLVTRRSTASRHTDSVLSDSEVRRHNRP